MFVIINEDIRNLTRNMMYALLLKPGVSKLIRKILMCFNVFLHILF